MGGISDSVTTAKDLIDVWKRAERGEKLEAEERLDFENLETLLKTLTSGQWALLKTLLTNGPISVRTLANELRRDYRNIHTDVRRLAGIGLINRTKDDKIKVPWDILEAQLGLAA